MDNPEINIISVCSGIGGLDLGVSRALRTLGFTPRTICYVEREAFVCAVLESRMETGDLDVAPIWTDIESFPGRMFAGRCDLVIGGLPCQPYSVAGKRLGNADERYIWPMFFHLLQAVRPALVFLENVSGLLQFFRPIAEELYGMGYEIEAGLFSAAEVGATHRRERLFILAYGGGAKRYGRVEHRNTAGSAGLTDDCGAMADAIGERRRWRCNEDASGSQREVQAPRSCGSMGDAVGKRLEKDEFGNACNRGGAATHEPASESGEIPVWPPNPVDLDAWKCVVAARPDLAPVADGKLNPRFVEWLMGLPADWVEIRGASRIDMLRALGNAVVPATADLAFGTLWSNRENRD